MNIILSIIEWLVLLPLLFTAGYLFFFAVAAFINKKVSIGSNELLDKQVALLVPGYKEDAVIVDTASKLLEQSYPAENWDLVIIADSFQSDTLEKLREMPLVLLEVSFEKSTKAKALNDAMRRLGDSYDIAVVLDADNIAEPDFLSRVVEAWEDGTCALQCHRTAKNDQTATAMLDAISEEVANHIFCRGHRNLGLSSRLVGSGMAFDYYIFKKFMSEIDAVGGFDKELEFRLLQSGYTIEYLSDVWVYDEKVSKAETMQRQRLRWIAAQYHYLNRFFKVSILDFFKKGNADFLDKTLQMILVPRLMLIGLSFMGMLASLIWGIPSFTAGWLASFALVFAAYLIGTPGRYFTLKSLKALLSLPKQIILMLIGMRKVGSANKKFIHTPHGNVSSQ
ncbi:MAG: glycosyltransferase family 2 protein [Bacteroidia bacterium]|nr:glycosyltransferase family 2 protein [Bacteroidia bacterium]